MRKSNSPPTFRDRCFTVGCIGFGILGSFGIGLGVLTCVEALNPFGAPEQVVAATTGTTTPPGTDLDLNDPNVRIHYGDDGRMYVDVYLTKDAVNEVVLNTHPDDDPVINPTGDDPDSNPDATVSGNDTESNDQQNPDGDDPNGEEDPAITENPEGDDPTTSESPSTGEYIPGPGMTDAERAFLENANGRYLDSDIVYTIQPGDTLTKISHDTGFSVDFLAEYNHIADKNLIIAWATLRYPVLSN